MYVLIRKNGNKLLIIHYWEYLSHAKDAEVDIGN